jgi:hypothetical protein
MKNLFVSAGLVALGAAALQQSALAADVNSPKDWSISGTLRGFYDDNYEPGTANSGTFGAEVSPSVSYHLPLQQTDLGIRYTYGLYYYQERNDTGQDAFDQTHQVDLWLDHAFNERWHGKFTDTFAAGQEPELLQPMQNGESVTHRVNGDNIANHGAVALTTDWARQFSTVFTYNNNFYDYDNAGATEANWLTTPDRPTLAGVLNRDENSASIDFKWHVQPETTLFVGYQYSLVNYTGDEPIAFSIPLLIDKPGSKGFYQSSDRDSMTHYAYVGLEHQFTPNLGGSARGGVSYTDIYNDPLNSNTSWAPYADVSLTYTYLPGSYVQVGFTQNINATDQVQPDSSGNMTQYAESSVGYASLNHKITSKLTGSVIGRIQYSTFQGGAASSEDETDYFSLDVGYTYADVVTSGSEVVDVGYSRNRAYLGLSANY